MLRSFLFVAVLLFAMLDAGPAGAQKAEQPTAELTIAQMIEEVRQATREIESGLVTDARLNEWQERLPKIRGAAQTIAKDAKEKAASRQALLDALGPPPETGGEPPTIEAQRTRLRESLDSVLSRQKSAELVVTQAGELLQRVSARARARFASELLVRGPSPLNPRIWARAVADAQEGGRRLVTGLAAALGKETAVDAWPQHLAFAAGLGAIGFLLSWSVRHWLKRRLSRRRELAPNYLQCLWAAFLDTAFYLLVPGAVLALVLTYMSGAGLLEGLVRPVAGGIAFSIAFFFAAQGLARAVMAVDAPRWRVLPLPDIGAARLSRLATLAAAVFAVDIVIVRIGRAIEIGQNFWVVHHLVFGVLITVLLARLIRRDIWTCPDESAQEGGERAAPAEYESDDGTEGGAVARGRYERLRGWLIAAVSTFALLIVGPVLFGYYELSRFFAARSVLTILLLGVLLLLHALVNEAIARCLGVARQRAAGDRSTSLLQFWLGLALNVIVVVVGLLLALPLWGLPWQELWLWLVNAAQGFKIGEITISPVDLIFAVLVFAAILAATRALQRMLETRVLPQTRLDVGLRDSMSTVAGYVGLTMAVLVALSTAGLDFSNLAIVAGALSVGIGFGLQAIVNNFVSGLILLFERPVKVGDWVVVGANEGMIRRIRVRSTEIDTFDRSTVIVPNSELISNSITNWTHGNRICRVILKVHVPYGCDTQQVHDLLMSCAEAHPHVLRGPEPQVLFRAFGESALEFELRVFARDTDYYLTVGSELNFAIDKAFREAGIVVPYPQRDLHIKSAPPPKAWPAAGRVSPRRGAGQGDSGESPGPDGEGE